MTFDDLLFEIDNPQIYTGREINVIRQPFLPENLNICLVFPDNYSIGMSHLGLKILYHMLNSMDGVNAERCFLPDPPVMAQFRRAGQPLVSIENHMAVGRFDLIAFSVLSELNFTNILAVLDLAGIPLLGSERKQSVFPLIAAGGISVVNPEPLRPFIDFFGIGDGERLFPDIVDLLREHKAKRTAKGDILNRFDKLPGIYVPALHPPVREAHFHRPAMEAGEIRKRTMGTMDRSLFHNGMIVPLSPAVFERLDVELARGCPQNCRFCQAKSYYAPYRRVSVEDNLSFIEEALKRTGFESLSLSTLSTGDYPGLASLVAALEHIVPPCVDLSFSSLRPGTLSDEMLTAMARIRKTGVTIVPEAGSERLRRIINKQVTNDEIISAVDRTVERGWQKIKLYFMIGLPGETDGDITDLIALIKEVVKHTRRSTKRAVVVHTAISSFVPKPHTPLQWAQRESLEALNRKRQRILSELKNLRTVKLTFNSHERGIVETILSRGDERAALLIQRAHEAGAHFTAWDNHFNWSRWEKLISELSLHMFLNRIDTEIPLPWDFIRINYSPGHLKREYRRALDARSSPSCNDVDCRDCDGCFHQKKELIPPQAPEIPADSPRSPPASYRRIRLFYRKDGNFRFFSHLTLMKYLERLIRKAGIRFQCTEGFHPRMKMSTPAPLPVYARGMEEVIEFFVSYPEFERDILSAVRSISPDLEFIRCWACGDRPALNRDIDSVEYTLGIASGTTDLDNISGRLGPKDALELQPDRIRFTIDAAENGIQRFASLYRELDPDKRFVRQLVRTHIRFKNG